mmetsp:Transcript_42211/g.99025  ORF Transcript_42211/g.99025 Transcript_42211/m.99025 type:complete len:894 (+) Transcript_42211:165-2846(+)
MPLFGGTNYWQKVSEVSTEGDKTEFTWTVGRVKKCSFGDSIKSSTIKSGGQLWKVVYFPKGFTDPDYASLYVTNVDCELDEGDAENPDRITTQAFATIAVTMTPKPPDFDDSPKDDPAEEDADDDEEDDGEMSVPSSKAPPSTSQLQPKGSKTGKDDSKRPEGSRKSAKSKAGAGDEEKERKVVEPIHRELSQMYTNKESSWGFEKLFDIGKLYKFSEGYMTNFGKNKEDIQMGEISMRIEIFCASGIRLDEPDLDDEITQHGRQRINWMVHNLKRITTVIGPKKKLSSSDFESDGHWYLDIYPNGFNTEPAQSDDGKETSWISLYLHSTRRQVELGEVYKVWFKFGIKRVNPDEEEAKKPGFDNVYFPPGASSVSVFTPRTKCFGKQKFMKVTDIAYGSIENKEGEGRGKGTLKVGEKKPEFTVGAFDNGGSVIFVLDMLVTDDEVWGVQHMLHEIESFGHKQDKCAETEEAFGWLPGTGKVICYHCGKAFVKEETQYQARMEEYGYEVGREYISDILMREEEHFLDKWMKQLNVADKIDQAVKYTTKKIAKMRIQGEGEEVNDKDSDDEDDEEAAGTAAANAKREKLRREQLKFISKVKDLQREVEDAHFSKPICSKCAEKRKMLQACKVIWANQPPKVSSNDICPDQNKIAVPNLARNKNRNFRMGWAEEVEIVEKKIAQMEQAMSTVSIKSPHVFHAADPWIKKRLSATDKKLAPEDKPGRNAMTLVRGNRYVEPLELTRQCNGRVNEHGITPQEDEDAPRESFCDVRFDVAKPPPAVYCLWNGKVYCKFCAGEKCTHPLPMFEERPSEAQPVQVCTDSKVKLSKLVVRIQAESKKEEEEVVPKRRGGAEEEEEDEPDEPAFISMFRNVPLCGNKLADTIYETLNPDDA